MKNSYSVFVRMISSTIALGLIVLLQINCQAQSFDAKDSTKITGFEVTDTIVQVLIPMPTDDTLLRGKTKQNLTSASAIRGSEQLATISMSATDGLSHIPTSCTIATDREVGEIPFTSTVTPTGAVSYSVPVELIAGRNNLQPNISLAYNSMAGNGIAGAGWGIGGLSSITRVPLSKYYDNKVEGVKLSGDDVFVIDGMRLIKISSSGTQITYEPEQGNMRVVAETNYSVVKYFTVYFSNGSKGIFGFTNSNLAQLTYPLTKLTDALGNYIDFTYTFSNENYYISQIDYGANQSGFTHFASAKFNYIPRSDEFFRFEAGKELKEAILLDKITTYSGSELINTYSCTYETNAISLLKQIDYQSQGKSLNPLKFYYGYDNPTETFQTNTSLLYSYFNNIPIDIRRGKFDYGTDDDGLIVYPYNSKSEKVYSKASTLFSHSVKYYYSATNTNQSLLVYQGLSDPYGTYPNSILAGNGFMEMFAANVDNNSQDEIIKINSNIVSNLERLSFNIYTSNLYTGVSFKSTANFDMPAVPYVDNYSVWPKSYFPGDFDGDGKQEILAVSMYAPLDNTSLNSKCYLFDLNSNTKRFDGQVFNYVMYTDKIVIIDYNGDGKADLCHINANGTDIYSFVDNSGTLSLVKVASYTGLKLVDINYNKWMAGDINGDGKTDISVAPSQSYYNTTYRTIPVGTYHYCPICGSTNIDGEYCNDCWSYIGYSDNCYECGGYLTNGGYYNGEYIYDKFCQNHGPYVDITQTELVNLGSTWKTFYGTGTGFVRKDADISQVLADEDFFLEDIDQDGMSDLVKIASGNVRFYPSKNGLLSPTMNATAYAYTSYYTHFISSSVAQPNYHSCLIGVYNGNLYKVAYTDNKKKQQLLTGSINSVGVVTKNYFGKLNDGYSGGSSYGMLYSKGYGATFPYENYLGPLWVAAATETYWNDTKYTSLSYNYYNAILHRQGLGFRGFERVTTYDGITGRSSVQYFDPMQFGVSVKEVSPTKQVDNIYSVSVTYNKKATIRILQNKTTNLINSNISTSNYTYDSYGNVISETVDFGGALTVANTNSYINKDTPLEYVIGLPLQTKSQRYRGSTTNWETVDLTYSNQNLPIKKITSVNGYKKGETNWAYNSSGGVLYQEGASYSTTDFLRESNSYSSSDRFIDTKTNALGLITKYSEYNSFGQPQRVEDYKGNITTFEYDAKGRLTKTISPDGVTENVAYVWRSGDNGVYVIVRTATGQPSKTTCYDAFGREVKSSQVAFDGREVAVNKEYDSYGRLFRQSEPAFGAPSRWATYGYDQYDRTESATAPSGRTTTYVYNGNDLTVNDGGLTKTTTTDASGAVITVTDVAGSINYNLRSDGQPATITAPGGALTTFTYDDYGRQTQLIDPSAGTITYGYDQWGNINQQTDAKGLTQSMTFDKYGLLLTKITPEMTVTYSYRPGDLKLESVTGGGTSNSYAYDNLLRTISETENARGVPITRTYSYNNGKINTTTYSPIASEPLEYIYNANGYLSQLKLGSRIIKTINAVNNFGQTTSGTLGNGVLETKGYDINGMPQQIKAEKDGVVLQNFGYSFNPPDGMLNWRKDNNRNLTESFTYDNLQRLTGYYGSTVTYDNMGNITAKTDAGNLEYQTPGKPYAVSKQLNNPGSVLQRTQTIEYNSLQKPISIVENGSRADFTYGPSSERSSMLLHINSTQEITRYYVAGCYEKDVENLGAPNTTERLYIGGSAYSAPVVYMRTNSGAWQLNYLHRDYLGSITAITNEQGQLAAEYSYDAWGRQRNPADWTTFAPGTEPVLLTGRGYTGHEHLPVFGLINMNGRLYDPVLGRFLSPDNEIQSPGFSQSYNRFSYCLNNPMLYIDPSGNTWLSNFGNWIGRNAGSIMTGVYLAATAVACIVAPPLGGAMLGAYLGGLNANGGQLNAGSWNWKSADTWLGIGFGAALGYVGGYGLANPGSIALKLKYLAPGIGAFGLSTIGNNFSFEWSTAAGGSGNYNLSGNQAQTAQQITERAIAEARENAANGGGQGEFRQYNPDFFDRWSESDNFLGRMSYDAVDGVSVTAQSLILGPKSVHLNGEQVSGDDRTDAFVNTAQWGMAYMATPTRFSSFTSGPSNGVILRNYLGDGLMYIDRSPRQYGYRYSIKYGQSIKHKEFWRHLFDWGY